MKKLVMSVMALIVMSVTIPLSLHAQEYKVEPGDSLWKIAREFKTSVTELYDLNNLDTARVLPGQVIRVKDEVEEIIHQIERGDTLYALAIEYEVTVLDLMNWNELESDLIITGHELAIYPNAEAVDKREDAKSKPSTTVSNQTRSTQAAKDEPREQSNQKTMPMTATAYTAECDGCSGITFTGLNLNEDRHMKVIAVDPDVIPLGTRVHVEGYGEAIAGDIGSAIKGNRIDIHVPTKDEAYTWGVREVEVTILE